MISHLYVFFPFSLQCKITSFTSYIVGLQGMLAVEFQREVSEECLHDGKGYSSQLLLLSFFLIKKLFLFLLFGILCSKWNLISWTDWTHTAVKAESLTTDHQESLHLKRHSSFICLWFLRLHINFPFFVMQTHWIFKLKHIC